jgi:hypothetical protein
LIQNEGFAAWRDAHDPAARLGACDQVALPVQGERAHMRVGQLAEDRSLSARLHAMDFAPVAGRDVEAILRIEDHVPNVFGLGIVIGFGPTVGRDAVNGAIRSRGGVQAPLTVEREGVDFEPFQLRQDLSLAASGDDVDARVAAVGSAAARIKIALAILDESPKVSTGRIQQPAERRRQRQHAIAGQRDLVEAGPLVIGVFPVDPPARFRGPHAHGGEQDEGREREKSAHYRTWIFRE